MVLREKPLVLHAELTTRRTLVISDIHGDREGFLRLLEHLQYRPGEDTLVLLGDYVNRGPDSRGTVQAVRELSREKNVFVLRGNNDIFLQGGPRDRLLENLNYYGDHCYFGELLRDAGIAPPKAVEEVEDKVRQLWAAFPEELSFLSDLPDILDTPRFLFAHAGLESEDLDSQSLGTVLSAPGFHQNGSWIAIRDAGL